MAVTKILAKTTRLDHLVQYVINPKKTGEQVFVSSVGCVPESAARTWMDTKRRFGRTEGVQAYHLIQSFQPGEITPELAHEIGNRFAERYLDGFEVIVGTHVDKAHVHNHIIFNSVSDRDGHKYHSSPNSYFREVRGLSDALCREYGLSVIAEPGERALTYVEWRMQKLGITTQRQLVDRDVAERLSLAMDVGGFYALMEDRGYTVQHRSRYPTFVPYGEEQGHRARVKGKAMTEDDLIAYIDRAMMDPSFEVIVPKHQPVHFPRGKVTGFRACVLAWAYILGLINDGIKPQYHVPPKELKRFEQLKKQAAYLTDHKLDTLAQVDARIADLNRQIDYQTKHRIILNGQKKRQKASFAAALEKQIKAKEKEYESLLDNMGQSVLSPDILDDITARMKTLKEEIKTLKNTTPPEEASTELIVYWLRAIREAPDSRAVHLLIEKVEIIADKEKTDFHIVSTLESVSEKLVRVVITDSAANGHIPKDIYHMPDMLRLAGSKSTATIMEHIMDLLRETKKINDLSDRINYPEHIDHSFACPGTGRRSCGRGGLRLRRFMCWTTTRWSSWGRTGTSMWYDPLITGILLRKYSLNVLTNPLKTAKI